MTETVNLGLPFIDGSQAQKHVTHNEALRILDDAIQIAVLDTTLTVPSPSPVDGERHIVVRLHGRVLLADAGEREARRRVCARRRGGGESGVAHEVRKCAMRA